MEGSGEGIGVGNAVERILGTVESDCGGGTAAGRGTCRFRPTAPARKGFSRAVRPI